MLRRAKPPLKKGQRIRLLSDPGWAARRGLRIGSTGKVQRLIRLWSVKEAVAWQVLVKWDDRVPGAALMIPGDQYEVLPR